MWPLPGRGAVTLFLERQTHYYVLIRAQAASSRAKQAATIPSWHIRRSRIPPRGTNVRKNIEY